MFQSRYTFRCTSSSLYTNASHKVRACVCVCVCVCVLALMDYCSSGICVSSSFDQSLPTRCNTWFLQVEIRSHSINNLHPGPIQHHPLTPLVPIAPKVLLLLTIAFIGLLNEHIHAQIAHPGKAHKYTQKVQLY